MKTIIGSVLVLGGVVFGVWAGLWWAFIGGIVQVIQAVQASPVDAMDIALGIARFMLAGVIGTLAATVAVIPGLAMLSD